MVRPFGIVFLPFSLQVAINSQQRLSAPGAAACLTSLKRSPTQKSKLFCFLPTSQDSELPVTIHGYFELMPDRRTIKTRSTGDDCGQDVPRCFRCLISISMCRQKMQTFSVLRIWGTGSSINWGLSSNACGSQPPEADLDGRFDFSLFQKPFLGKETSFLAFPVISNYHVSQPHFHHLFAQYGARAFRTEALLTPGQSFS